MCFWRVYLSITISYPSTQFKELYGPFVNLGPHLPQNIILPKKFLLINIIFYLVIMIFFKFQPKFFNIY